MQAVGSGVGISKWAAAGAHGIAVQERLFSLIFFRVSAGIRVSLYLNSEKLLFVKECVEVG